MCRTYPPLSGLDPSRKSRSISFGACLVTLAGDGIRLSTYLESKFPSNKPIMQSTLQAQYGDFRMLSNMVS